MAKNENIKEALLEGVQDNGSTVEEAVEPPKKSKKKAKVEVQEPVQYIGIGLRNYATNIAGKDVYVEAGKPWSGPKVQYDVLKRANLIQ